MKINVTTNKTKQKGVLQSIWFEYYGNNKYIINTASSINTFVESIPRESCDAELLSRRRVSERGREEPRVREPTSVLLLPP